MSLPKALKIAALATAIVAPSAQALSLSELACGATICLTDEAAGGSACNPYLDKYYSIKVTKHGKLLKSATERARKQFLKKCKKVSAPPIPDLKK